MPDIKEWRELYEDHKELICKFFKVHNNADVKEVDNDFYLDSFNYYLHMDICTDQHGK